MATFDRRPADETRVVDGQIHERYRPTAGAMRSTSNDGIGGSTPPWEGLPFFVASQLHPDDLKPVEYVDGHELFLKNDLSHLSGAGAIGKTTLALQLASSVAISEDACPGESLFLGRPVGVRGTVLFVSGEDDRDAIHRRLIDIAAAGCFEVRDLSGLIVLDLGFSAEKLMIVARRGKILRVMPLFDKLKAWLEQKKPKLVIIDNRAQVIDADEIDRNVATAVTNQLRALAHRYGCSIIMLTHPSLSGMKTGTSGSTGWQNTSRNHVGMVAPEQKDGEESDADDGKRQLVVHKSNYGKQGRKVGLRWEAGVFIPTDRPQRAGSDIGAQEKARRVFLELLRLCSSRGINVSANKAASKNYAPTVFAAQPKRENVSRKAFEMAMEGLLDDGTIAVVDYRNGGHTSKRLEVVKCNP